MTEPGSLAGVILQVWVTPRSSPERIGRLKDGRIRAYVAPPPDRGRANAHLVALLARVLGVPRDAVRIVAGTSHPKKLIHVGGCTEAEVAERIRPLSSGHYTGGLGPRRRRARGAGTSRRRRRAARSS